MRERRLQSSTKKMQIEQLHSARTFSGPLVNHNSRAFGLLYIWKPLSKRFSILSKMRCNFPCTPLNQMQEKASYKQAGSSLHIKRFFYHSLLFSQPNLLLLTSTGTEILFLLHKSSFGPHSPCSNFVPAHLPKSSRLYVRRNKRLTY